MTSSVSRERERRIINVKVRCSGVLLITSQRFRLGKNIKIGKRIEKKSWVKMMGDVYKNKKTTG
jgi:hypothetical protein